MTVSSQVKQTLVNLQTAKATFESLEARIQRGQSAKMFNEASLELKTIIEELKLRVEQLEYEEPQYKGD
jgi:hypothetical protein